MKKTLYTVVLVSAVIREKDIPSNYKIWGYKSKNDYINRNIPTHSYEEEIVSDFFNTIEEAKKYAKKHFFSVPEVDLCHDRSGEYWDCKQYLINESIYNIEDGEEPDFIEGANYDLF